MSNIDLDCIVNEPVVFTFKNKKYKIPEATLEQHIRHRKLMAEVEVSRNKLQAILNKKEDEIDQEQLNALADKMRQLEIELDEKILNLFIPDFKGQYKLLTASQRDKLFDLLFSSSDDEEETKDEDGKKNPPVPEENNPGEK